LAFVIDAFLPLQAANTSTLLSVISADWTTRATKWTSPWIMCCSNARGSQECKEIENGPHQALAESYSNLYEI